MSTAALEMKGERRAGGRRIVSKFTAAALPASILLALILAFSFSLAADRHDD